MGYASFLAAVIVVQAANLLICKTRRLSLFQQGLRSWVFFFVLDSHHLRMFLGICSWFSLWSSCLSWRLHWSTFLVWIEQFSWNDYSTYRPSCEIEVNLSFRRPLWWLCPVPFALIIFAYDEIRKLFIRKHPDGWVARETYHWIQTNLTRLLFVRLLFVTSPIIFLHFLSLCLSCTPFA